MAATRCAASAGPLTGARWLLSERPVAHFRSFVLRFLPTAPRRLWLGLASLLLLTTAGIAAFWWYGADRYEAMIDDWVAARRAEGYRIDAPERRIAGFPLRWEARFPNFAIAAPAIDGAAPRWAWQGHAVTIAWSLFDRNAVRILNSGTSSVDLQVDGSKLAILIDSDGTEVRLAGAPHEMQHVGAKAERLSLSMNGLDASAQALSFDIGFDSAAPADHTIVAGTASLDAKQLVMTVPGRPDPSFTLSGTIAASLMGKPPPGPLPQSIASWRDEGGTIELSDVDVISGGVAVKGSGTVSLDGEMRPIGAGTANFRGIDQALERLIAGGQMSARDLPLAKLAFNALAKPDAKTGALTLTLPVTAENGFLFIGPIKVAPLRPLRFED